MYKHINPGAPIFKVLLLFISWRFILVIISLFAVYFIPLANKDRFLGGGFINYNLSPYFFAWANFDGEHYLSIAIFGYKHLEQAFFPLYPILIFFFSRPDPFNLLTSLVNTTVAALILSNCAFVLALIFLFELIRIDFPKRIAWLTILLILVFPTSFYFGAVYNESLFLLFSVLSFYLARKNKWMAAGITGAIASALRVFGILLFPALLIEAWQKKESFSRFFWIFLIPFGLLSYMFYLFKTIGDPVAFYTMQKLIGEQHQEGIILLPQVYFRYIKMLIHTDIRNPIFQTVMLELITGIMFFLLPVYGFLKKIRLSYIFFAFFGFLIPTVQGSFSSTPRYVIILFPAFITAALLMERLPKLSKIAILSLSFLILILEASLFLRGYWIA